MSKEDPIIYTKIGAIAKLKFNRPKSFNALNRDLALNLQACLDNIKEDEEVRAIIITGAGKAFCAGQDLQEVIDEEGPELADILDVHLHPITERIRALEKPIIGAVNGVAAGAGASLALACDITLAAESASFIQAFSKIGLIPDSGSTFFLPRLVGLQRATALMMLGNKVSAQEAADMGMIYKAVPDEKFEEEVLSLAETLAQMPTLALGLIKRAVNKTFDNDLSEQLGVEDQLQGIAGQSEDYAEGVRAFIEKRSAKFIGK